MQGRRKEEVWEGVGAGRGEAEAPARWRNNPRQGQLTAAHATHRIHHQTASNMAPTLLRQLLTTSRLVNRVPGHRRARLAKWVSVSQAPGSTCVCSSCCCTTLQGSKPDAWQVGAVVTSCHCHTW